MTAFAAVAVMPSFLLAASGVLVRVDLNFDAGGLGMAITAFFAASACASVFGGHLAEHVGAKPALLVACLASGLVLMGMATVAGNLTHLVIFLLIAGAANGVAQPAASLALSHSAVASQGLMFGVKQSGVPLATLLSGASVPLAANTWGWRGAFVGAFVIAVLVFALIAREPFVAKTNRPTRRTRRGRVTIRPLLAMSAAASVGMGAAVAFASFLVEALVANGVLLNTAGWLLAAGSLAGIIARMWAGWFVDRRSRHAMFLPPSMLLVGAVGYGTFAVGGNRLYVIGALLAFAGGLGWTGLLLLTVVRLNPHAPAVATGIVQTGLAGGAAVGPAIFGLAVTHTSFQTAWVLNAGAALVSALLMILVNMRLIRARSASN